MAIVHIFGVAGLQPSLSDTEGSSALVVAVQWVQIALLGSVASAVAVMAVAAVGLMMFHGRISLRHGATVIIGCFSLFGSAGIAAVLKASVLDQQQGELTGEVPISPPPSPSQPKPNTTPGTYDPYAGASVPLR